MKITASVRTLAAFARRPLLAACFLHVVAMVFLGAYSAQAQTTHTWTQTAGGAQNWTTDGNWSGGTAPSPVSGDTVDFSTVNIANDTTLTLGADRTAEIWKFGDTASTFRNWTVASGNKIILAGTTPTIDVVPTAANYTATLNCVLDGSAGLKKDGAGILALGGVNTFTGPIILNGGRILGASLNTLGSGGDITFTGSTWITPPHSVNTTFAKSVTVDPGVTATFYMISQFYNMSFTGPLAGSGTAYLLGPGGGAAGSLKFTSDSNTFTGTIQISSQGNGSVPLTVNSLPDSTNPIKFTGTSWPGDFILGAGTATPLLFNSRQIELGGTTQGGNIRNNNATATNTITINTNLLVSANGNKTLTLGGSNTGDNTFAGVIGDGAAPIAAVISLTKADAGKWILTGANTYTGNTTIADGTLEIRGAGQLGAGGTYAGNITNTDATPSPFTFDSSANTTISGVISGGMSFIKDGTGTLSLTGSAIHTGGTTVAGGTLSLGDGTNSASLSDFGTLSVASGGAKLDLNYVGSDAVFYLNLGGSPMAAGQYGHTNSGADNGGAGVGFYDAFFAANTGIINNLNGDSTSIGFAFWDGGTVDIGSNGNAASGGGAGTWDTAILNWDYGTVAHAAWLNTTSATAVFGGTGGIVTLGADMNIQALTVNLPSANGTAYSIGNVGEDNTLTFGGTKTVTTTATGTGTNQDVTITAGIAGSPTMNIAGRGSNSVNNFNLLPGSGVTQTIGTLNMLNTFASNKRLILGGDSTGNVVDTVTWPVTSNQLMLIKTGPGSWTINNNLNIDDGRLYVEAGTLTLGGTNNIFSHKVGIASTRESGFTASGTASKLIAKGTFTILDNREYFYVQNLGTLSPGPGVETLTVRWTGTNAGTHAQFNMQTGSTYEWDIASATSTDIINVQRNTSPSGSLTLGNMTIKVNDAGVTTPILATDQLTVFTYQTGVTRSIGTVTIDVSALGAGWGGTPSLVDNGTGTIYITGLTFSGGATTYDTWAAGYGLQNPWLGVDPLLNGEAGANPDADALTNLLEFGFAFDPTVSDGAGPLTISGGAITQNGPPQLFVEPGTGKYFLRYTRRTDYVAAGLTYTAQFAADSLGAGSFEDVAGGSVVGTGTGAGGVAIEAVAIEFPDALPGSGKKARFGRVQVTTP